jgi:uncharacterized protein YjiS (DUF1127 family)
METEMNGISNPALRSAVAPSFRRIVRTVRDIVVKRAVARALSAMDDNTLKDLGISRCEIRHLSDMAARTLAENEGARAPLAGPCTHPRIAPAQVFGNDDACRLPLAA